MGKYTPPHQLTDSSMLHFLCRDRKDSQHLNHNLNDHVAHSHRRCDASIYLKPAEETFNAVKDVDKLVLASARIFSRLGSASK
jgi:predicted ester cyclase